MLSVTFALIASAAVAAPTPTPVPIHATTSTLSKATQAAPRGKSLAEVARSLKLRFPADRPKVITNENLKDLAGGAELTTGAPPPPGSEVDDELTSGERREADRKEYWQKRFFAAQQELADLEAEEKRLTGDVARLEREFYARDDPYQRDNVIKPAWDEALSRLRDVQGRLVDARKAPDEIANEARRDGALPGWFREKPPSPTSPAGGGESSPH